MVENCYSATEERSLRSIRGILALLVITSMVSFAANAVGKDHVQGSPWLTVISSLLFSSLLFMLLHAGHRQDFTIKDAPPYTPKGGGRVSPFFSLWWLAGKGHSDGRQAEPAVQSAVINKLTEDIERLMLTEKTYLQPDLRINDLARRLNTNRDYIYKAINVNMRTTFNDYINRQRTEYACRLLREDPAASSTDVFVRSGFTSQASFFRNFKHFTGMSPKQYAVTHSAKR